jgi:hypothetical protein
MSNRTVLQKNNLSAAATRIAQIDNLANPERAGEVTESGLPAGTSSNYKPSNNGFSKEVIAVCKKYRIPHLAPVLIPTLVPVDVDSVARDEQLFRGVLRVAKDPSDDKWYQTTELPMRGEGALHFLPKSVNLPVGETSSLPFYKPPFYEYHYSIPIMKQILHHYYLMMGELPEGKDRQDFPPKDLEHNQTFVDDYMNIVVYVNTHFFGTGSLNGMIYRLKQSSEVHEGEGIHYPTKSLKETGYSLEEFAQMLEYTMPIPDEGYAVLNKAASSYLMWIRSSGSMTLVDFLPRINLKGAAGQPFSQSTAASKMEAFFPSLAIIDAMLNSIQSLINQSRINPNNFVPEAKKFVSTYPYLFMCNIFPKSERYEKNVDPEKQKTRNIFSYPLPCHLIGMMSKVRWILDKTSARESTAVLNFLNHDTPSAQKFSAFHGGMNGLIDWILSKSETSYIIYSDNIWMKDGQTWYSMDLTKGEANCNVSVVQGVLYYYVTRLFFRKEEGKLTSYITENWLYLLLVILPLTQAQTFGILGNQRIAVPGQTSGNSHTFENNHAISSRLVMELKKSGDPHPGSTAFALACKKVGTNIKTEREVGNIDAKIFNLRESAPDFEEYYNRPDNELDALDIDFLGWSAVFVRINDRVTAVPVLQKERFMASLILPSKPKKDKEVMEMVYQFKEALLSFVQLKAMWLLGGWHYKSFSKPIMTVINSRLNFITTRSAVLNAGAMSDYFNVEMITMAVADLELPEDLKPIFDDFSLNKLEAPNFNEVKSLFLKKETPPKVPPLKSDVKFKKEMVQRVMKVLSLLEPEEFSSIWSEVDDEQTVGLVSNNVFTDDSWASIMESMNDKLPNISTPLRMHDLNKRDPDEFSRFNVAHEGPRVKRAPKTINLHGGPVSNWSQPAKTAAVGLTTSKGGKIKPQPSGEKLRVSDFLVRSGFQ